MDTTNYQARLEEEKRTLEKELTSVGRLNAHNPRDWEPVPQETGQEPDPSDRAEQIEHYEDNTAILKDLEIRYNEVIGALERIEKGTYGTCKVCGKEIESSRLQADPSADTCIEHRDC